MSITGPYTVSSGSSANGTIVDNGGILYVDSGGSTSGTVVNSGGYETVYTGGVASGTKVSSGGFQYVDGGTATSTVVSSGGDESVSAGGYALDTQVENGGSANVEHGGSTSGTVVSSGGYEIVSSNGSATGTKIRSGGFQDVYVDGTAISATVSSGGEQDVSNGIASSTVIASGGDEYVSNGGSTVGTIVSGGGYEYVYSGGSASGTTVDSGGYEYVYYGGSATRTTVDSGGYEEVDIGAFESGAQINSGGMFSLNGGQATGVVVSSGGALELTISSALGAWTPPAAGATIDGVKISAGAEIDLNVVNGGSVSGFIVGSGGYEQVQSGGFESGGVVKSGGVAEFEGGEVSGLVVSSGGVVDLSNLAYVAGSSGYLVGTPSGGQYPVTVTEGSATATFYVASSGSPPTLHLVADSAGGTDVEFLGSATVSTIAITGAVAGQKTTFETPIDPFSGVTLDDAIAGATDVLTIKLTGDGGTLADGSGFSGLTPTPTPGVFTLSGTAAAITSELDAVVFTPAAAGTTNFTLSDANAAGATMAVDNTTSVVDTDPAQVPTLAITSAAGLTHQATQTISGTIDPADAGLTVSLYDGTTLLGTAAPNASGVWSNSFSLLLTGQPQSITAQATDADGYTATSPAVVYTFVSPPSLSTGHANDIAFSGDVRGPDNFIDIPNLVASYGDLIAVFGTNYQAAQNWYNANQSQEQRADTFDGLDYVASYGDLIGAFKSAGSEQAVLDDGASHYIAYGFDEGRTTTFNGLDYIASYGDLIQAFGANGDAGAYHYIEDGASEGRTTTFDGLDYIASYSDLIHAFGANEQAGAEHFIDYGYSEGRTTSFDGLEYIASYGDLMKAFGANNDAGATHYIDYGFSEGRSADLFNVAAYKSAHPDLIGKYATTDAFLTAYINDYVAGKPLT